MNLRIAVLVAISFAAGANFSAASAEGRADSPVIKEIQWAPTNTILRLARGSDRFPMTWAADNGQYTAWGDGVGFSKVPKKLSLGYARITGSAENFNAEDIRSPSGEGTGDGRSGLKASAMLSLNGTLYLWVGNANHAGAESRLAWSTDHARTWTWAGWRFREFGYISLVQFGKDYAGARDQFVYGVAHDHPSEYVPANRFVLMRCSKERLRERESYEFLAGYEANGAPRWTKKIDERGALFTETNACLRQQVSYNAALKRYLWWQQRPNFAEKRDVGDTRFIGGFQIYDAPEPWGPWTRIYATDKWDVGPGETASFPTKWMSADGKTLHLVFSGDDCFSVRRAAIVSK